MNSILRATHPSPNEEEAKKLKTERSRIYERLRKAQQSAEAQKGAARPGSAAERRDQRDRDR